MALMFGFVKIDHESVIIANPIFETRLYNLFLTLPMIQESDLYKMAFQNKTQFFQMATSI